MSAGEAELAFQLKHATAFPFERQYKFLPDRKFAADFAVWPSAAALNAEALPLLLEVDGVKRGAPGAHQRADGVAYDCERQALAMIAGYRMMRVVPAQVKSGQALQWIERVMAKAEVAA